MMVVYTDGACSKSGSGGWAYVVTQGEQQVSAQSGHADGSTNNQMELMAVIMALKDTPIDQPVTIISDSKYVVDGINEWVYGWVNNGWISSNGTPVKNKDHWKRLWELSRGREITFEWVKGHAGDRFNEIADKLAQAQSTGSDPVFPATHRHLKTGGLYRVIRDVGVKIEATWEDGVLYENEEGIVIVRSKTEFYDGRFEKLTRAQKAELRTAK